MVDECDTSVVYGWDDFHEGIWTYFEKNLPQCHLVLHKFHLKVFFLGGGGGSKPGLRGERPQIREVLVLNLDP